MKIAYTTITKTDDIRTWSGLNWYIMQALINTGSNVQAFGDLKAETIHSFIKGAYYGRIRKQTFFKVHDTGVLKGFAQQVHNQLAVIDPDLVFSPKWEPVAYLKTDKPIAFWHDATIPALMGFYPGYDNTCRESINNAIKAERLALEKCHLAIYSSDWAAHSAVDYYGIDPEIIKVVPFGANLKSNRNTEDIHRIIDNKGTDVCKLLFIGGEWQRKGGDLTVEVVKQLNSRGIASELHIVGQMPPMKLPNFVIIYGFISKATIDGLRLYENLLSDAHFLISPTQADCTPLVFPEAASFGLPVLTTDVGGIPTVIHAGKNGQTFPLSASAKDYCDHIQNLWSDQDAYQALCLSSFQEYISRLNWKTSGENVAELLDQYCG